MGPVAGKNEDKDIGTVNAQRSPFFVPLKAKIDRKKETFLHIGKREREEKRDKTENYPSFLIYIYIYINTYTQAHLLLIPYSLTRRRLSVFTFSFKKNTLISNNSFLWNPSQSLLLSWFWFQCFLCQKAVYF